MKISKTHVQQSQSALHGSLAVTIFREGKSYIAYSPALDLSTAGKSLAVVQKNFSEAVRLFVEELMKRGTLNEVLSDLGWEKTAQGFAPPAVVGHEEIELDYAQNHTRSLAHV